MKIQVNQELCAGCGICMETCSVGAIYLMDHLAVINDELCTQCEACVEICPNGAIKVITEPSQPSPIVELPVERPQMALTRSQEILPKTTEPPRGLIPLVGSILTFVGREIAPRLVDLLVNTLERRFTTPTTHAPTSLSVSRKSPTKTNHGMRRQTRNRGQRKFMGSHKKDW